MMLNMPEGVQFYSITLKVKNEQDPAGGSNALLTH